MTDILVGCHSQMMLFGFAEECVIEKHHGEPVVAGAADHFVVDGVRICNPDENSNWKEETVPCAFVLSV